MRVSIHPLPNQFTGGEGPVTGMEVQFNITFNTPFTLGPNDHVFFRPEVDLGSAGDFLWLSAPKSIVFPCTNTPDLQTWIRNDGPGALAPDWSRIGTDITHQGPFNAAFTLTGTTVPEPETWVMMLLGFAGLGFAFRQSRRKVPIA